MNAPVDAVPAPRSHRDAPAPGTDLTDVAPPDGASTSSIPVTVANLALGVALVASMAPWTISGTTARSSYASMLSADRLGLADHGPLHVVVLAWLLLPALVGATWLLALVRPRSPAWRALAAATAALVLTGAALALSTGSSTVWAPALAATAASTALVGVVRSLR